MCEVMSDPRRQVTMGRTGLAVVLAVGRAVTPVSVGMNHYFPHVVTAGAAMLRGARRRDSNLA